MSRICLILLFLLFQEHLCVITWEPRILSCKGYTNCTLKKSETEQGKLAECRKEDSKHICDIECDGADRDSVISKAPTDFRPCSRFFTYNSQKSTSGKWFIWRDGRCAESNITLTIHCGF